MGLKNKIFNDGIYFVTFTIVDWIDIFTKPIYKHIIVDSLKYCQENKGLIIHSWCLMTNHIHIIASPDLDNNLSDIIRDFKKFTNKSLIRAIKENNESRRYWILNKFEFAGKQNPKIKYYKVWQDGNESKVIYSNKFLYQKIQYIHNNPVKAEIVEKPEDYLYSSAIDYTGGKGLLKITIL